MNMFQRGQRHLNRRLLARGSVLIAYARGSTGATNIRAVVGQFTFRVSDGYGVTTYSRSRDYLVDGPEFLTLFGEPQAGDTIIEQIGESVQTYEVMAPGGEQPWRWSDQGQQTLRIHTSKVGEEAA